MDTSGNVIVDTEVTGSAVSSIDCGSPFLGDADGWYTVIARHVYDTSTSTLNLTFNADTTTSNYGYLGITGASTTVASVNSTSAVIRLCAVASGSTTGFSIFTLYAKQGAIRIGNGINVCNINGTTVTQLETIGSVWNNTNTQITNMVFTPSAGKIGVGGRVIVLRGNAFPTNVSPSQIGAWKRVGSSVLSGAASSVCYYLSQQVKGSGDTGAAWVRPNNDSGATNYGYQYLSGNSTSVSSARGTTSGISTTSAGNTMYSNCSTLIFAKSGFIRPVILCKSTDISGTTITATTVIGQSWNNTADNITSIVIQASTNNFAAGSQFDLYALYA
jgi:hypothetical protein